MYTEIGDREMVKKHMGQLARKENMRMKDRKGRRKERFYQILTTNLNCVTKDYKKCPFTLIFKISINDLYY